jgi:hypothetical protein
VRREEIIVVYLTVWKVCGKVLDAVSLGFSFSGKGEREVLNKIDSFQIFSVKRKNKIKDYSSGCTVWLLM